MMAQNKKDTRRAEFGDFQTPMPLAEQLCALLQSVGIRPASIVEPTCGVGNLLIAAAGAFPDARTILGADINGEYVQAATQRLGERPGQSIRLRCGSFFTTEWQKTISDLPEPVLVIGNPPWVTNSDLSVIGSENLPRKSNFQGHVGLDAMTGKSNFDISEWMLVKILEWLREKPAALAMLCKTAVARKALKHAWVSGISTQGASLYLIDAQAHFGAAVDACFLVCKTGGSSTSHDCAVFKDLKTNGHANVFGYRDDQLVADVAAYDQWKHLQGRERYPWRSGIKHDCAGVMELRRDGEFLENKAGEKVVLEPDFLYPMLKSSAVAAGIVDRTDRYMLVPQKSVGDDTASIESIAPNTWAYLQKNRAQLDRRGSSIYRNRPPFSIFGIGHYSFAPWKVAISGFYKSLKFRVVGPIDGKPTVFDDTCNFISCHTRDEAAFMAQMLNSEAAAGFFKAFIFWDAKRPLTIDLLKQIDLLRVAEACNLRPQAEQFLASHSGGRERRSKIREIEQLSLFDSKPLIH